MAGDHESKVMPVALMNHQLLNDPDASNRLALCGNLPPLQFHGVPLNFVGNFSAMPVQQKPQCTQISGRKNEASPNLGNLNDIRSQLDMGKAELDHFIALQEENMAKGICAITKKHTAAIKAALEKAFAQKLQEKDVQLRSLINKNILLSDTIRKQTAETHKWRCVAESNESLIVALKHKIQQVTIDLVKEEGFGEHDPGSSDHTGCRCCGGRTACVVLMPCRHLCLCKVCDGFVNACPVCNMMKASSIEVSQ